MAVTSWHGAANISNVSRTSDSWSNPTNAVSSNNSYASCTTASSFTDYIRFDTFSFGSLDLPAGSTVFGIEVRIERSRNAAGGNIADETIRLRTSFGQVGNNKASGTAWPTSDAQATYGTSSDMWGTILNATDIKTSGFGIDVAIRAQDLTTSQGLIDYLEIRVWYTVSVTVFPNVATAAGSIPALTFKISHYRITPSIASAAGTAISPGVSIGTTSLTIAIENIATAAGSITALAGVSYIIPILMSASASGTIPNVTVIGPGRPRQARIMMSGGVLEIVDKFSPKSKARRFKWYGKRNV